MSSPFAPSPQQQPQQPENRLPEWVTNKPKWFWIALIAAVWIAAMFIKPIIWPTPRGGQDFEQPRPIQMQNDQKGAKAQPPANDTPNP